MSTSDFNEVSFDLSQYALSDKIGQGGFGVVYQVVDKIHFKNYLLELKNLVVEIKKI